MIDWTTRKIGEFATVKGGKRLPKGKVVLGNPTPYPYIRAQDFVENTVDTKNLVYIDKETHEHIKRYTIEPDDIYITIVGHGFGTVGMTPEVLAGANLTENAAKISVVDQRIDPAYVMFFLNSKVGQSRIRARVVGSSQPKLPLYAIKEVDIDLPPFEVQCMISNFLGSIREKIELNRRMNETLEQVAMALYKHWFVEFGPFQDGEFVESELGMIPKGWEVKKLSELVETQYGYTASAQLNEVGPHFLRITDI